MTVIAGLELDMTLSTVPEDTTTPVWDATATYMTGDEAQKNHKIYVSALDNNTGNDPEADDGTRWVYKQMTNRWAWSDEKIETQTRDDERVYMEFVKDRIVNRVALFGLEGSTATVAAYENGQKIYEETVNLKERLSEGWNDFFFDNDFDARNSAFFVLPFTASADAYFSVSVDAPGATAAVGTIVAGRAKRLGCTLYYPTAKVLDFSTVTVDDWGNTSFRQGSSAKLIKADASFESGAFDHVYRSLDALRSTPAVYLADDRETGAAATLQVYGYFDDMNLTFSAGRSRAELSIRGLI